MATGPERGAIANALRSLVDPIIVELGARAGEDRPWISLCCSGPCHYVMVEPDPRNCQIILDQNILDRTTRLILGAVGDADGMTTFWLQDREPFGSGSILKPAAHTKAFPEIEFSRQSTVPVYTLDTIYQREWLQRIDLLWCDIQGAEGAMIRGGTEALKRTRYLMIEAEVGDGGEPLYEGELNRSELLAALGKPWKLIGDFGVNLLLQNKDFAE